MRLAVLADIHGNSWALEAVLADLENQRVDQVVDLGDVFFGPLDPGGTATLVLAAGYPTIRGNQDRAVISPSPTVRATATWRFVNAELGKAAHQWLHTLPTTLRLDGRILLCHGTPSRDDGYLVEEVGPHGIGIRSGTEIADEIVKRTADGLADTMHPTPAVVLCGHSHVPRLVALPDGALVVNPGSVGLPAYTDDLPYPHTMEAGSPHARYAVLEDTERGWVVEHRAIPYDVEAAVSAARRHGREDWATCLATGRG